MSILRDEATNKLAKKSNDQSQPYSRFPRWISFGLEMDLFFCLAFDWTVYLFYRLNSFNILLLYFFESWQFFFSIKRILLTCFFLHPKIFSFGTSIQFKAYSVEITWIDSFDAIVPNTTSEYWELATPFEPIQCGYFYFSILMHRNFRLFVTLMSKECIRYHTFSIITTDIQGHHQTHLQCWNTPTVEKRTIRQWKES